MFRPERSMPFTYEHPHPAVTVDVAAFTTRKGALNVLLVRRAAEPFQDLWALPGGFVEIDEPLEAAAVRELREETGIETAHLEQFHAFGEPGRDPRERVISVAHLATVRPDRSAPRPASDAREARWFALADVPVLAFDHTTILVMAIERFRARFDEETLAPLVESVDNGDSRRA